MVAFSYGRLILIVTFGNPTFYFYSLSLGLILKGIWGSLWFTGRKGAQWYKTLVTDPSQMYNLTTIGLPTTIPVHLNR